MHMKTNALLDHSTTQVLLRPSGQDYLQAEDFKHPWLAEPSRNSKGSLVNPFAEYSSIYLKLQDKPLLRVWDTCSGSQPEHPSGNRMRARLRRGVLATRDARKTSLTTHVDNSDWKNTPYISFTSSPSAAVRLANQRHNARRGDQNLVVIDPGYRLQRGLPVLDMANEAEWYGVECPYPENYFTDHYLCLWEVTPAEVVDTWSWDDLRRDDNWYENIIVPAFKERRAARQRAAESLEAAARDVDALSSTLGLTRIDCESVPSHLLLTLLTICYNKLRLEDSKILRIHATRSLQTQNRELYLQVWHFGYIRTLCWCLCSYRRLLAFKQ